MKVSPSDAVESFSSTKPMPAFGWYTFSGGAEFGAKSGPTIFPMSSSTNVRGKPTLDNQKPT